MVSLILNIILIVMIFGTGIYFMFSKINPTKNLRQLIFPMANVYPETIDEIEYIKSIDFSAIPLNKVDTVTYYLLKESRSLFEPKRYPHHKMEMKIDPTIKKPYIHAENNIATIYLKN